MNINHSAKNLLIAFVVSVLVLGLFTYLALILLGKRPFGGFRLPKSLPTASNIKIDKFASEEDFKTYLSESASAARSYLGGGGLVNLSLGLDQATFSAREAFGNLGAPALKETAERVSETNVQVTGIDEPDIVKLDSENIYFSFQNLLRPMPLTETLIESDVRPGIIPPIPQSETQVVKAFPPTELAKAGSIRRSGTLLLYKNNLIIFSGSTLFGYDISDAKNPKEYWSFELDSRNSIVTSRLFDGKIYIVSQQAINDSNPCPIPLGETLTEIACKEIYYPKLTIPVDSTFTVLIIDPDNGEVLKKTSFVGSSGQTVIYMSGNAVYLTYPYFQSLVSFYHTFLTDKGQDLISKDALSRLAKLQGYDISESTKMTEMQIILEKYYSALTADERKRIENEFQNRLTDYSASHLREFQKTAILRLRNADLSLGGIGEVPGSLLNQFSLDEYKGNLRVATTISGSNFGTSESVNDVYILSNSLSILGQITDLGISERIYSARFVEDKGYVVTFKQTDPFYVLDLADPRNPKRTGELKIPGFSSYLHPITKDKILGVGRENANVKLSLFDVADPANPQEVSKYSLSEYWSQIADTHHAFLLDDKHQVFFLPAGASGYIFSYQGDELKLERVVSDISAQRAVYIDDYMYIIGDTKIVVLDESTWSEVNSLPF